MMAHRGGSDGFRRGGGGFRQKGRSNVSPYWKDKQGGGAMINEPMATPKREPKRDSGNASPPNESPVEGRQVKEIKKFSNKARLFIANLPRDTREEELRDLFSPYGEVQEVFVQKEKNFAFCRMAYKSEAEAAILALNSFILKGREIKVRFAAHGGVVKVDNIHGMVTNELLAEAFSHFGEVDEAVVVTDFRGKSKGFGIVEFERKQSAMNAIAQCKNTPFLLTRSPVPVVVTEHERDNYVEGQPLKNVARTAALQAECEIGPRFASPNDVEFVIAQRWLSVFDEERAKRNELEIHIKENRAAVKDSIVNIREQHQTELMRQELVHHQQEQMRLLMQLRERDGGMPPSMPGLPLMPTPPHFSGDLQEGGADGGGIPGLGGFPQPLMGQPGFENFH